MKRHISKYLAILLALVMVLTSTLAVFAVGETGENGDNGEEVTSQIENDDDDTGITDDDVNNGINDIEEDEVISEEISEENKEESPIKNTPVKNAPALRSVKEYTVTFDAGEGSGSMKEEVLTDESGEGIDYPLPDCTFDAPKGKDFKSWKVGESSYAEKETIHVTDNITVVAQWKTHVHSYGDWTITIQPTYFEEGQRERSCWCGDVQTESVPKLIAKNKWVKSDGKWYYFNGNGDIVTGWQKIDGKWYFFNGNGVMQTGWQKIDNKWYYMNTDGTMHIGWLKESDKWYYMNGDGTMRTGWVKVDGKWYFMHTDGTMHTGWLKDNGKWYFMHSDGPMHIGWLKVDGKWYYTNSDGIMCTGWVKVDGKWYYMHSDGPMHIGWLKVDGKWYYMNGDGTMRTGWLKDSGKYYYLNGDGAMRTGWLKENGKYYYLNGDGVMRTGWLKESGKWYYFNASGAMITGWLQENGKKYYFNASGAMVTGWAKDSGNWYYMNSDGIMQTGWLKIKEHDSSTVKWCWFNSNGVFTKSISATTKNKLVSVGGYTFYFDSYMRPAPEGFYFIDDELYYVDANGAVKHGTFKAKDGNTYTAAKDGTISKVSYYRHQYSTFILIDISEQTYWYYKSGKQNMKGDVVTGMKGIYDTPTGNFKIVSKSRDVWLTGPTWNSHVDYWMPFIGSSYGMHDATWRTSPEFSNHRTYITNGSHGCVNMRPSEAATLYGRVSVGTKVIVTK